MAVTRLDNSLQAISTSLTQDFSVTVSPTAEIIAVVVVGFRNGATDPAVEMNTVYLGNTGTPTAEEFTYRHGVISTTSGGRYATVWTLLNPTVTFDQIRVVWTNGPTDYGTMGYQSWFCNGSPEFVDAQGSSGGSSATTNTLTFVNGQSGDDAYASGVRYDAGSSPPTWDGSPTVQNADVANTTTTYRGTDALVAWDDSQTLGWTPTTEDFYSMGGVLIRGAAAAVAGAASTGGGSGTPGSRNNITAGIEVHHPLLTNTLGHGNKPARASNDALTSFNGKVVRWRTLGPRKS